jgi:hypothetical protein
VAKVRTSNHDRTISLKAAVRSRINIGHNLVKVNQQIISLNEFHDHVTAFLKRVQVRT